MIMSYFRANIDALDGYQPGFQPREADVVKLNTNENPYPPSPRVMEVLRGFSAERLRRYPEPLGDEFRRAAGALHGVGPEYIVCCNGGDELLSIAFRAFCDRDRPVAYPVPSYTLYPVLAKLQECPAIEVPFDEEFNLPAKLAGTGAPLTIVCNPNAPSGTCVGLEELACLADELRGVLLIDEAYVDFAESDCTSLVKDFENVIILRSMSKGYSLAGLRFGYAIARPGLVAGLAKVKDSYNVDALAIALATAALGDQEYFRQNVCKIKAERRRLTEDLAGLGFEVPPSWTNFVLARCRQLNAAELHRRLAERGIYVRYFPCARLDDKLRITVGTAEQNDRLVAALKEILAERG